MIGTDTSTESQTSLGAMKKTKYVGRVKGCKTYVTFTGEEPMILLSRFCSNYGADITDFKEVK